MPGIVKRRAPLPPSSEGRAAKAAKRRSATIDAALDEFSEKGFAATRVEDIARRAGVAKGTIYLQFKDKEALFEAIVRQELFPVLGAAASSLAPGETVRAFLERTILPLLGDRDHSRRGAVIRLLVAEAARFPRLAELYFRMVVEPGLARFGKLARLAVETGELKSSALARFPQLFIAPALMGLLWSALFESYHHLDVEEMMRAYFDQLFVEQTSSSTSIY